MNTQVEQVGQYEFSAAPQPVGARGKYRDPNEQAVPNLLMDKGNRTKGQQGQGSKAGNQSRTDVQFLESDDAFQTSNNNNYYLEPLQDDIDDEAAIVPDYYVDRPPTPEFKPKERGLDIATQIQDNELFDYQLEVEPILQVLVGKTVDQARMELIEEFEQIELKKHKAQYEIKRNAELMVTQRMEAAYIRRQEEKERRNWQHKLNRDQQKFAHKKLISRLLIKKTLCDLKQNSLQDLENQGFLRDQMILKLRANFLPWVLNTSLDLVQEADVIESQIEALANEIQDEISQQHKENLEKEKTRREQILHEREVLRLKKEERKRKKEEWKRKNVINQERQLILDFIWENILNKAEKIENIKDCEFADITGDNRRQPITSVFSGLIGQVWVAIESANSILSENPLNSNQIYEIRDLLDIVLRDFKNGITLKLSENQREYYENLVKTLQEAVENIPEAREEFINNLLANESLYIDEIDTTRFLRNTLEQRNGSTDTYKQILRILFEHHAKNLKPDPVEEKPKDEQNTSSSQNRGSAIDLEDKIYRQKIKIIFENTDDFLRNQANIILRLRTPFLTQQEMEKVIKDQEKEHEKSRTEDKIQSQNTSMIKQENDESKDLIKQQSEVNKEPSEHDEGSPASQVNKSVEKSIEQEQSEEQVQEEEEKCKYDEFVEIFDGEGYKRQLIQNLNNSQRRPLNEDNPCAVNIQVSEEKKILYFDERTLFYLESVLHKAIKEVLGNKVEPINFAQFQQLFADVQDNVFETFFDQIYDDERLEKMPAFDVDFGFNIPE